MVFHCVVSQSSIVSCQLSVSCRARQCREEQGKGLRSDMRVQSMMVVLSINQEIRGEWRG